MKKLYPRIRKAVKWGGTVLLVLLVGLCIFSRGRYISYLVTKRSLLSLTRGQIGFSKSQRDGGEFWAYFKEMLAESYDESSLEGPYNWRFEYFRGNSDWNLSVPLWFPIALVLLPTALAWRFDILAHRRARMGNCPTCNYDRAGLAADAVCPECGKAAVRLPLS